MRLQKGSKKKVIKNPKLVPEILEGVSSPKARTKFGCAKIVNVLSGVKPGFLLRECKVDVCTVACLEARLHDPDHVKRERRSIRHLDRDVVIESDAEILAHVLTYRCVVTS